MTHREQAAGEPVNPDPQPIDPIAELEEILAEVQANPRIWFTEEDYDLLEEEQIGYVESVYPHLI